MTQENYDNKALWIFKNFKETIDVLPKKYRGRAWEILINYAFGEIEEIKNENAYIQMAVKSLLPLVKLRGKGGSINGISNNPSGKNKANVGANINANVGANVGATPYITETITIKEKEKETITEKDKPTKKQISDYCSIQGIVGVNLDDFYNYYEAVDWWDDLKNRPINWKQKLVSWKMNQKSITPKPEEKPYYEEA